MNCEFCDELHTGQLPARYEAPKDCTSRVIFRSENFAVFPSLSPIAVGHILIVPTMHVQAIAALRASHFAEFATLSASFAGHVESQLGPSVLFEHGVGAELPGGCGVSHAHSHILPMPIPAQHEAVRRINRDFELVETTCLDEAAEFVGDASYLLVRMAGTDSVLVSKSDQIPSQYLRRSFADCINSPAKDWRWVTGWSDFARGLAMLRQSEYFENA